MSKATCACPGRRHKHRAKLSPRLLQFSEHTVYAPTEKEEVSRKSVLGLRFLELCSESQGAGCTEPRGFPVLTDPVLSLPHHEGSHDLRVCEQQNQGLVLPNEFPGSRPPDRTFRNMSDVLYVRCPIQ